MEHKDVWLGSTIISLISVCLAILIVYWILVSNYFKKRQKAALFLVISILFTVLWAVLYWQYNPDIWDYIVAGSLFGLAMTVVLTFIQFIVVKVKGIKGKVNVVCSTTFLVTGTQSEVFELCREASKAIDNCKLGYYDPEQGLAIARTASTWRNLSGEEITFSMHEIAPGTFKLFITSRPQLRTAIIDFGVNLDHMNRLITFIKNNERLQVSQENSDIL